MADIASFEFTKEGYTDYSKSKSFPRYDDYKRPNPLSNILLPKGILPLEEILLLPI